MVGIRSGREPMTPSGAELLGRAERLRPQLLARQAEAIRHDLAESAAEADAARLLLRRTVHEVERAVRERIAPTPRALIELVSRDRHFATRLALRATERLFHAAGSRALFAENELQRCFRDVHAVASRLTRLGMVGKTPGGGEV
jgi:alkylation response protein AidB-like acyl-CoA dehydrogenase